MNQFAMTKTTNSLVATDPAAVAAAETAKARIQAAYIMALQKPRDEDQARAKILKACKRPEFAKDVEFKKPVGGKRVNGRWQPNYIEGLSIRFCEVALKEWGNLMTETQTLYEDANIRRIKVSVTDMESNTSFSKELQINKTVERRNDKDRQVVDQRTNTNGDTVYIVVATEDELMTKENALISKCVRNEGLRLIPNDIKEEAKNIARDVVLKGDASDPDAAKKAIVDGFSSLGVMPADLQGYLGHGLSSVSPSEINTLRGIYKAIKDNESSWADYAADTAGGGDDSGTGDLSAQFDKEFSDISGTDEFKSFLQQAINANAANLEGTGTPEQKFKTAVMNDNPKQFRVAYLSDYKISNPASAKKTTKKSAAKPKTKSAAKTKTKAKGKAKKEDTGTFDKDAILSRLLGYQEFYPQEYLAEAGNKSPEEVAENKDAGKIIEAIQTRVHSLTSGGDDGGIPAE
jgi:hypothetical protein